MIDEILCTRQCGGLRIALRREGRLVQLIAPRPQAADSVGAINLGRVRALLPGMEAAFVDIGTDSAGFLSFAPRAARKDDDGARGLPAFGPVTEGQPVLVQVSKAPQAGKGAGLVRNITLAGRFLVFSPFRPGIRVSRRIADPAERKRLEAALSECVDDSEGLIIRTAAAGADPQSLAADVLDLRRRWAEISAKAASVSPPRCLDGEAQAENALGRALRDFAHDGLRRIRADAKTDLRTAREFLARYLPESAVAVEYWSGPETLFDAFGVDDEIAAALEPVVPLPCGGSIVIETTAALTAIDVNSGRHAGRGSHAETIFATNLEAAAEIAHQMRLRGIGGLAVVDFIHMDDGGHRDDVLAAFRSALADDPEFIEMTGFSSLGLVELARRRSAGPLATQLAASGQKP